MWRAFIFILLTASGCLLIIYKITNSQTNESSIERAALQLKADTAWIKLAENTVPSFVAHTPSRVNVHINPDASTDGLRIYLFDSRNAPHSHSLSRFVENCAYLGNTSDIFCDVALLERFLTDRQLDRIPDIRGDWPNDKLVPTRRVSAAAEEMLRKNMLLWVMGHEIGHFEKQDIDRAHLEHKFDARVQFDTIASRKELQADQFVIDNLAIHTEQYMEFLQFLVDVLNREIRLHACPHVDPFQYCKDQIYGVGLIDPYQELQYVPNRTHPEYIVRLLRILSIADEHQQISGLGYQVGSLTRGLRIALEEISAQKVRRIFYAAISFAIVAALAWRLQKRRQC